MNNDDSIRRWTMTGGAVVMMVIGIGITWGGAALCLLKAMKR